MLGWFYGPFLAAVGVIGALVSPFVVGGSSDAPHLLFYYFALIVVMALAIDAIWLWAWVSVLALIGGFFATWMLLISGAEAVHALVFGFIASVAATAIPVLRIWPNHQGSMLTDVIHRLRGKEGVDWPDLPTRLAGGTVIAALVLSAFMPLNTGNALEGWLGLWCLLRLGRTRACLGVHARALEDLSALAPIVLLILIVVLAADSAVIFKDFIQFAVADRLEGMALPRVASVFSGMFALFVMLGFLARIERRAWIAYLDRSERIGLASCSWRAGDFLVPKHIYRGLCLGGPRKYRRGFNDPADRAQRKTLAERHAPRSLVRDVRAITYRLRAHADLEYCRRSASQLR